MELLSSPLDDRHRALGATMAEFGGWEMPISYPSGTIAEHMACRTAAAVFDLLLDLNRSAGTSLIIVTHDVELAARTDRTLHLVDGRLS